MDGINEAAMRRTGATPLLDGISYPSDLRLLADGDLRQVADELRAELIDSVSVTGGISAPGWASSS